MMGRRSKVILWLLVVIIFDKSLFMKGKKKTAPVGKKAVKKAIPSKPIMLIDKTLITTKERTHNTIQQTIQNHEARLSVLATRQHTGKLSHRQRIAQSSLSPFSSQGGSLSPKFRKAFSPLKEEKDKKKGKVKTQSAQTKNSDKKKVEAPRKQTKQKVKHVKQKEYSAQAQYQSLLLRKMGEKKITELSEQSVQSIKKPNKFQLHIPNIRQYPKMPASLKQDRIRHLKHKVYEKYRREYPYFKKTELKFFCSIVLIQRLWRQKKIKNFISEFISPRPNLNFQRRDEGPKDVSFTKFNSSTTQEQTSELIKKYHLTTSIIMEHKEVIEKEFNSTEMQTGAKKINLKDLELSEELSPARQAKIVRFVQCVRDISFSRPHEKQKTPSKINVFNLQESLSEKCLMQRFYEKIFKDSPAKRNNFQLFTSKKEEKSFERSIQLINTLRSPEKLETIELEEKFQVEMEHPQEVKSMEYQGVVVNKVTHKSVETSTANLDIQSEVHSVKQLNTIADSIIALLLAQFTEEWNNFKQLPVRKKKKQTRLPGLYVSASSIREYLQGLVGYMFQKYENEVLHRYNLVNHLCFLRIYHDYDDEDYDQPEEEFSLPIIPPDLFFSYQVLYEKQKFFVPEDSQKFSNFLEGLIKLHNLLLVNCFSEILQKSRIDRICLPWDLTTTPYTSRKYDRKSFEKELNSITETICNDAFMRLGHLRKRLDDPIEEEKILRIINQQYKNEGNEWNAQQEYLELRLEMTNYVEEILLQEIFMELIAIL